MMNNGSQHPFDVNVQKARDVVALIHQQDVWCEGKTWVCRQSA